MYRSLSQDIINRFFQFDYKYISNIVTAQDTTEDTTSSPATYDVNVQRSSAGRPVARFRAIKKVIVMTPILYSGIEEARNFADFPKDRNCEACKRTKMTRAPCRKRAGEAVPRAEFGDLTTADHKVLNEGGESRNNHRCAVVVQDLATQWIQPYRGNSQNLRNFCLYHLVEKEEWELAPF